MIPAAARPEPMIAIPMPASPQKSSSMAIGIVIPLGSFIMASAMNSQP